MNYKNILKSCLLALMVAPVAALAAPATPAALRTHVETNLKVDIDKNTSTVHFISTTNDPDIITKTYILKHADPYELRPYLRKAITSSRINSSNVKVEALKYNDGTGILIVSAEDYKFDKAIQGGGMTIDDIVTKLDLPKITSSSGKGEFIYFPKYAPAASLAAMLRNVGMDVPSSIQENSFGKDFAYVDRDINAIWFYVSTWSVKHIRSLLSLYDQPYPEVQVIYKIYEIDRENDDKIGADWQAWKNGPGSDLFAAASRYASGWDFSQSIPGMPWVNNSHTEFVKFSPRWNTRFLDLVSAKGYAKVVTSGVINLVNRMEGHIDAKTQYTGFVPGQPYNDIKLNVQARWDNAALAATPGGFSITDTSGFTFMVSGIDKHGRGIGIINGGPGQNIIISRHMVGPQYIYYMKLDATAAAATGTQFAGNGAAIGHEVQCTNVSIMSTAVPPIPVPWNNSQLYTIEKDAPRDTAVHTLESINDAYGFHLSMTPEICGRATTLTINEYNTSLIGFESNGTPRTERSEINTRLMVANDGSTFVIGGIEKKSVINSVSKLPWLGSVPGLGWLLGTEGATGKSARIVAVLECRPIHVETQMPQPVADDISKIKAATKRTGKKGNKLGFDQFWFDKEKKSFDKLP